jgi:arsenate reductase
MAEGWTRALKGDQLEPFSAGIQPKGMDARAVRAMAEAGVDISKQKSKDVDSLGNQEFEYVVTLCDNARESCPFFPAKTKRIHQGFDDPPVLTDGVGTDEEAMVPYRRVRDEIKAFVQALPESLRS